MNWLDLGVIAVIVLSAVFAFARGFVREALSIVAWVGAALITRYGFSRAFALVEPHVQNRLLSQVIAGVGLFVIALVILTILTGIAARFVHATGLTPIDRTVGLIFGLARGVFLVCLAYLLLDLTLPQVNERPEWIRDAKSGPSLHEGATMLQGVLQDWLPDTLKIKSADDVIKALTPAQQAARLMAPPAVAPAAASAPATTDYSRRDQRQLDQVIRTQQQH